MRFRRPSKFAYFNENLHCCIGLGHDITCSRQKCNVMCGHRVGAVCYDVPLFGSRIMTCADTRQVRPVQYANWQYYSAGSWSDVVKGTGEPLKI